MSRHYATLTDSLNFDRRELLRAAGAGAALLGGRLVLGVPSAAGQDTAPEVTTNIDDFMKVPRGPHALPGPFPGRVVKVTDPKALAGDAVDGKVVREMVEAGHPHAHRDEPAQELPHALHRRRRGGAQGQPGGRAAHHHPPRGGRRRRPVARRQRAATAQHRHLGPLRGNARRGRVHRRSGSRACGSRGCSPWPRRGRASGMPPATTSRPATSTARRCTWRAASTGKGVRGYQDDEYYLNQHVFNGEESYFGTLVTKRLTKIVNLAAYKNTGNGISMATKNIGYAAICNTGRLHQPLFFKVCTEVLAAPWVRDKLVLNITDGLRGQYDGGPDKNEKFVYPNNALYFATDPFALDMVCHRELMAVRKAKGVTVNEHPRFTEYLHYAERLGLGVVAPERLRWSR